MLAKKAAATRRPDEATFLFDANPGTVSVSGERTFIHRAQRSWNGEVARFGDRV